MASGLLVVSGSLDPTQFWPGGTSDGDTAKVKVGTDAFKFRPNPGAAFKTTHVFDGARVKGQGTKPVVDSRGRLTIRFQGIDAPELHYMPQALVAKADRTVQQSDLFHQYDANYRQRFGEAAAEKLTQLFQPLGPAPIPCTVTTAIDHPNDAFDMYGRLIGDIIVKLDGKDLDLNLWMLQEGWAFPTYYNSMSSDEIEGLQKLADGTAKAKKGVWRVYKKPLGTLDFTLKEPKKGEQLDPNDEKAPVIMPKLFRRQVTFEVNKKARMTSGSFEKFLTDHPDRCYLTADFLAQGPTSASPHRLNEFVKNDAFTVGPGDLVFREGPSVLIIPGGGKPEW